MWNNSNSSLKYEEKDGARAWFQASMAVCWIFAALVTAFNIAVIVTIVKYRKPSRLYFLLLNMAVAGLIMHKVFTGACWMISICGSIPLYISFHLVEIPGKDVVVCHHNIAVFPYAVLIHVLCVALFVVPLLVIVCSYLLLISSLIRRTEGLIDVNESSSAQESRPFRVFNTCLPRSKLRSVQLMCGIVSGFLIAWIPFFMVVYMKLYADFLHPSLPFLFLSYYLSPLVNPVAFFLFHRLRLQRSTLSVYSGTTPLKSLGESRHVRFSTMHEEMKVNFDKAAITDYDDQEETVFCDSGEIVLGQETTQSIVMDENGIDDETGRMKIKKLISAKKN